MHPTCRHVALCLGLVFAFSGVGRAQWTGLGAGGTGTDIDDTANWSGGTINGNFSTITTSGITLTGESTANISVATLNFNYSGTSQSLTVGTGVVGSAGTINITNTSGDIIDISSKPNSVLTLGSDLTLALGSSTSARTLTNYVVNTGAGTALTTATVPLTIINSKITGGTSSQLNLDGYTNYEGSASAASNIVLTNTANSFTAGTLAVSGVTGFTSIASSNTASALGSSGSIAITSGGELVYVGSGDQTSNRTISTSGSGGATTYLVNDATTPSTLTLNVVGSTYSGTYAQVLNVFTTSSNSLIFTNTIVDNVNAGNTGTFYLNKTASQSIGTLTAYTGGSSTLTASSNGGVLVLEGNSSTYSGGTAISSGILLVANTAGSATGSGTVTLSGTGTTLSGTGIIGTGAVNGLVSAGAGTIIAPGVEANLTTTGFTTGKVGTLTLNGGLTEAAAGTLQLALNLNGTSAASLLSLGGGALTLGTNNTINLTFTNLGGGSILANNWYTVMSGSGNWASSATITDTSGLPAGFSGFSSMYSGGVSGGTLQVEFSAVPEPSPAALLAAGLGLTALATLRRRLLSRA